MLTLPVSVGEAVDKCVILQLKLENIADPAKLANIQAEYDALSQHLQPTIDKYRRHYNDLYDINKEIWILTDLVKEDPRVQIYNQIFTFNEARFRVKTKFNALASSIYVEEKSYAKSHIIVTFTDSIDEETIIGLTLLFDKIVINLPEDTRNANLFSDEPTIHKIYYRPDTLQIGEPRLTDQKALPRLEFPHKSAKKALNYVCGGRLGDFLHAMWVIKVKFDLTGKKGNLFITGNPAHGGDWFTAGLERTYEELINIVTKQEYIESFAKIEAETKISGPCINLNNFRRSPQLSGLPWLELLAKVHNIPVLKTPWIVPPAVDTTYADTVVFSRSPAILNRQVAGFDQILREVAENNKCIFLTCKESEYHDFPCRDIVPLVLVQTLSEMYAIIAGCRFLVANQTSTLVMGMSMFKPALCEHTEGQFYINGHEVYEDFFWATATTQHLDGIERHLVMPTFNCNRAIYNSFHGQQNADEHIKKYFPLGYIGTCIETGLGEAISGSNTYHFEANGWRCLCIEPNVDLVKKATGVRKHVVNCANGAENKDDVDFSIYTLYGTNETAISSLKVDERVAADHAHLITGTRMAKINVRTLNDVIAEQPWITQLDFLSIDTENTEVDVLKGFDIDRWQPKLFVIENNYDEPFIAEYLAPFGYVRDQRIGVNDFFIKNKE